MTEKLDISKNFTIEDIHKVRAYNYLLTKNMAEKERSAYYESEAEDFLSSAGIVPKHKASIQHIA